MDEVEGFMEKKSFAPSNRVPNLFIEKHQKDVTGMLHSFDRLRLQSALRYLYCAKIFEEYLSQAKMLCKDFKQFATGLTNEVCERAEQNPTAVIVDGGDEIPLGLCQRGP